MRSTTKLAVLSLAAIATFSSCSLFTSYKEVSYDEWQAKVDERKKEEIPEFTSLTIKGSVKNEEENINEKINITVSEDMEEEPELSDAESAALLIAVILNLKLVTPEPSDEYDVKWYLGSDSGFKMELDKNNYVTWDKNLSPTKILVNEEGTSFDLKISYKY